MQPNMLKLLPTRKATMNTLHVRSVPDNLYKRIRNLASVKNRSLSAQVITLLTQAVDAEERRVEQAKVLTSIQRRRFKAPKNAPTSLELLHEDRGR
jgi:plasmid stability protein